MSVAELIAVLQTYPQTAQVVIEDADTNWIGPTIHHEIRDSTVVLWIEYHEMETS